MLYADYSYYTSAFGGTLLSQQEFESCCDKAQSYIDYLTLQKAAANITTAVKNAVCAAAEAIKEYSKKYGIKSETTDGYSVTYASTYSSEMAYVSERVKMYLEPTGLLYCPVYGGGGIC